MNHPNTIRYEYQRIEPRWEDVRPADYPDPASLQSLALGWNVDADAAHLPEALAFIAYTLGEPIWNKRNPSLVGLAASRYAVFASDINAVQDANQTYHLAATRVTAYAATQDVELHHKDSQGAPLILSTAPCFVRWTFGYQVGPNTQRYSQPNEGPGMILARKNNMYIPAKWEDAIFPLLADARRVHNAATQAEKDAARAEWLERLHLDDRKG